MMLSPGAIGAVSEVLSASDFYRESHSKIYRAGLALYARGEPVDAITLVDELDQRGELEDVGRQGAHPRAGGARPRRRERRPLRAHRARDGDAARADPRRQRDRASRHRTAVGDAGARRPRRADDLRPRAVTRHAGLQPHRGAPEGRLRAHHGALRGRRRRHRRRRRLQGHRPPHVRLPARQPRHPRRPAEHGQVGPRAVHGREPRGARRDPGGAVHARDVEGRGHAAPHVLGGEGRVPAAADGQARPRRLAAPHRRVRPAVEGADLRRRHGLRHDDGDPVEGTAAEDARAQPRADHRRLPPADDVRRVRREPRPGGIGDLAVA